METKKRVGRPNIYINEITKSETRKTQNRNNQRRHRRKEKLFKELDIIRTTNNDFDRQYRNNIIQFNNQYEWDYFFTGTIDPNHFQREMLKEINYEIKEQNQKLETEFSFHIEKKIGIKSLRRYTEKYIDFISKLNLIERSFVYFELGKNNKYHVHILFKSDDRKINFTTTTENSWLVGTSITLPIKTQQDQETILKYCVKELKPSSSKITDMNKVDNWFLSGDFSMKQITPVLLKERECFVQSQIE